MAQRRPAARRTIGRRPLFFLAMAVISVLLVAPAPSEFRWVCWFCTGLSLFWAVALAAEELGSPGPPPGSEGAPPLPPMPFGPPPSPGERS